MGVEEDGGVVDGGGRSDDQCSTHLVPSPGLGAVGAGAAGTAEERLLRLPQEVDHPARRAHW